MHLQQVSISPFQFNTNRTCIITAETNHLHSGKNQITDRRSRLSDEVIESIECMKSWRKAKLIVEENLSEVETMVDDLENQAIRGSEMKGEDGFSVSGESDFVSSVC